LSNRYFKTTDKKGDDEVRVEMAKMQSIMNYVYCGKVETASNKLEKLDSDSYSAKELVELKNFILAFCYKIEGDEDNMATLKNQIDNSEYLK
jgi:hypothetical protein